MSQVEDNPYVLTTKMTAEEEKALLEVFTPSLVQGEFKAYKRDLLRQPHWQFLRVLTWIVCRDDDPAEIFFLQARRELSQASGNSDLVDAWLQLQRALEVGQIKALGRPRPDAELTVIDKEAWVDLVPLRRGSAIIFSRHDVLSPQTAFYDVRFFMDDVREMWPPVTRAFVAVVSKAHKETHLERVLTRMMQANPKKPIPKSELKKMSEASDVSNRGFDRAYQRAAKAAPAPAWTASGRRPAAKKNDAVIIDAPI